MYRKVKVGEGGVGGGEVVQRSSSPNVEENILNNFFRKCDVGNQIIRTFL